MMRVSPLRPLREIIKEKNLTARRSLGQNFLLDMNLIIRITRSAGDLEGYSVLEIGPGPGGLTRALLMQGAKQVIAIERDRRFFPALEEISKHYPGKLELLEADALKFSFSDLANKSPIKIIANLPYNIATELLVRWLGGKKWPPWFESMTLMFQKEVAERIVAHPGSKAYGRLSVLAGWRTDATIAFHINRKAFTPSPSVTSSIVHFSPKKNPLQADIEALDRITRAAFSQSRKMLRHSLKEFGGESFLQKTAITGTRRPTSLTIAEFVSLANLV